MTLHMIITISLTETLQNPGAPNGETTKKVSSSSTKISQSSSKSHTSTIPPTTGTSGSPVISPESADSINEFSFSSYSIGAGANPHKEYPLNAHSALCSNGAESSFYSPCGYDELLRSMSSSNQASKPTTVPRESAPFQQSTGSIHYHPTTPTSGLNQRQVDSDSLLLLANCATLATAPDNGVQSQCPSLDITEVSNSNV